MSFVYSLELEGSNFYVGSTRDLSTRVAQHFLGRGALWTRQHRPIEILQVVEGGRAMEDAVTIAMMVRHGWRTVRGGSWCCLELKGMPDPIARAYAMAPPKPAVERDERVIFDHGGQAVAVRRLEDGWQARITGPMAVAQNPASGVVQLGAPSEEEARRRALDWINEHSDCGV